MMIYVWIGYWCCYLLLLLLFASHNVQTLISWWTENSYKCWWWLYLRRIYAIIVNIPHWCYVCGGGYKEPRVAYTLQALQRMENILLWGKPLRILLKSEPFIMMNWLWKFFKHMEGIKSDNFLSDVNSNGTHQKSDGKINFQLFRFRRLTAA